MFCPECKSEYREGFTHCESCNVDLVAELKPEPESDVWLADPVVVFTTFNPTEAALVQSVLEGSGIDAELLDESMSRMDSPVVIAIGGIKVIVPSDQEALAREVLAAQEETSEEAI
jgi:hypothetical protein